MTRWRTIAVAFLALVGAVYLYYTEIKPVVIFGLRSDYAHAIPFQKIPEGLTSLKAESCGQCHREIYEEWKSNIHARAYEDPYFQAYWNKDKRIWVCLICHTPLENQQPTVIKDIPRGRVEKAVNVGNYEGIVPSIAGWARQTGLNTITIDDRDPFAHGFSLV